MLPAVRGRSVRAERHGGRRCAARRAGQLVTHREPAITGDRSRESCATRHGRRTSDGARDDHEQVPVPGVAPGFPDQSRQTRVRSYGQGKALLSVASSVYVSITFVFLSTSRQSRKKMR